MKLIKKIIVLLLLTSLSVFTGCQVFPGFWKVDNKSSTLIRNSNASQILTRSVKPTEGLNFNNGEFSLRIPAGALSKTTDISITRYPPYSFSIPNNLSYTQLSSIYSIRTSPASISLLIPAIVEFSYGNSSSSSQILSACKYLSGGWSFLEPEPSTSLTTFSFATTHFSDWVLIKNENYISAPNLIASPSKMIASEKNYFTNDLELKAGFGLEKLITKNYSLILNLYNVNENGITLSSPLMSRDKEVLCPNSDGVITIDLIHSKYASVISNNKYATSTLLINYSGIPLSSVNKYLTWKLTLSNNNTTEKNGTIEFIKTNKPDTIAPEVTSIFPENNSLNTSNSTKITYTFSESIATSTFANAFSITPKTSNYEIVWNGDYSIATIQFPNVLQDSTEYTISLEPVIEDLSGNKLPQQIQSKFKTRDSAPPTLLSISPNLETPIYLNSAIIFKFSKPIATQTLSILLSPNESTNVEWSANRTEMTVLPDVAWTASQTYSLSISDRLADDFSNYLTQPISVSFATRNKMMPSIVSFSPANNSSNIDPSANVIIEFNQIMNPTSVSSGLKISPASPSLILNWSNNNKLLTLTHTSPLQFSTTYKFNVSSSTTNALGLEMQKDYSYSFKVIDQPKIISQSVTPSNTATSVASNTLISINFSTEMNKESVQKAFSLTADFVHNVEGTFSWNDKNLQFTPHKPLDFGKKYYILVNQSGKSSLGYNLKSWISEFTVKDAPAPRILATIPPEGATKVANYSSLKFSFSQPMATDTVSVVMSPAISGHVSYIWSNGNKDVTVSFQQGLVSSTNYKASISSNSESSFSSKIKGKLELNFTTETTSAPGITSSIPAPDTENYPVNSKLIISFSDKMNKADTENSLTITPDLGSFTSKWTTDGKTLSLTPDNRLNYATNYVINVSSGAKNISGQRIFNPQQINFTTESRPEVLAISPASGAVEIATNTNIEIQFSKDMNHTAVESALSFYTNSSAITGQITWNANTLTFSPLSPLPISKVIYVSVDKNCSDISGNKLSSSYIYSFTTISATNPIVFSTVPANNSTNVAYNSDINITFSQPMATESVITNFAPTIDGFSSMWNSTGTVLTISHALPLESNTQYSVSISAISKGLNGLPISGNLSFSFTTETFSTPVVVKASPKPFSTNVFTNSALALTFNKGMNTSSVESNFSIYPNIGSLFYQWSSDNKIATITTSSQFSTETTYQIKLLKNTLDSQGLKLNNDFLSSFTTESPPAVLFSSISNNSINVATDTQIEITFSKQMDTNSAQQAFSLIKNGTLNNCTFNWVANKLICIPQSPLTANSSYNLQVAKSASDARGNTLETPFSISFATVNTPDFNVNSTIPTSGETNIPVNTNIQYEFSNSVNTDNISISFTPAPTGGYTTSWSKNNKQLSIIPGGNLAGNTVYTVTIGSTTSDIYGLPLGSPSSISFTTEALTNPSVTSTQPPAGSYDIPINAQFSVNFDHPMNKSTVENSWKISPSPTGAPSYDWNQSSTILTISFANDLSHDTSYLVKIASSATDINGLKLSSDYLAPFQTVKRPEIVSGSNFPTTDATNIATNTVIRVSFSKEMNSSATEDSFALKQGINNISGSFSWSGNTLTFTPANDLISSSTYSVTISTGASDNSNNHLAAPFSWSFSTSGQVGKIWDNVLPQTNDTSTFSPRKDHVLINFKNSLWVIGGDDGEVLNDVWQSSDGVGWTKKLSSTSTPPATQFTPRAGHACLVSEDGNTLWLTGGYTQDDISGKVYLDDVWNTTDGITWRKVSNSAAFYSRAFHCMANFNNKMWIIAGKTTDLDGNEVLLDDSWSSEDGITWTKRSNTVSYFPRFRANCGVINDKLWVWGGYGKNSSNVETVLNDIWYTSNGDVWLLNPSPAPFIPRCGAASAKMGNSIWLIGGANNFTGSNITFYNDVWATSDGFTWNQIISNSNSSSTHFSPRAFTSVSWLGNKIFISGGENNEGLKNEMWSSQ